MNPPFTKVLKKDKPICGVFIPKPLLIGQNIQQIDFSAKEREIPGQFTSYRPCPNNSRSAFPLSLETIVLEKISNHGDPCLIHSRDLWNIFSGSYGQNHDISSFLYDLLRAQFVF